MTTQFMLDTMLEAGLHVGFDRVVYDDKPVYHAYVEAKGMRVLTIVGGNLSEVTRWAYEAMREREFV